MNILKYIRKYIISLVFVIPIFSSFPCFATGSSWTSGQAYSYFENHFDDLNTRLNGIMYSQNDLRESFEDYLEEYRDNYNIPSGTSINNWIDSEITGSYKNGSSGPSDLGISQSLRQAMRDWCNTYTEVNSDVVYGYTYNLADYYTRFDSLDQFRAFANFVSSHETNYHCLYSSYSNGFILVPNDTFNGLVIGQIRTDYYDCNIYYNWSSLTSTDYALYKYNTYSKTYTQSVESASWPGGRYLPLLKYLQGSYNVSSMDYHQVNSNRTAFPIYRTFEGMQQSDLGVQGYYVTDSYNSTISGSYNTTTTDIESTIDYGDVTNYITNYYGQTGEYPSPTNITIYINNYGTEDPNPSPSPTPGPGGGGDDNDNDFDWGFLDDIGDFIGHLISALGNTLSGILDLLTGVVDLFIGENGLPHIMGQLIAYFLPFLPEEMTLALELFIVLSLILGVIKLIRGH